MAASKAIPLVEFRVADANAVYRGVSLERLMENAGRAVASLVERRLSPGRPPVLVVCGKGNNGADGLVAARLLASRCRVTVVLAEGREALDPKGLARKQLDRVEGWKSLSILEWGDKSRAAIQQEARRAEILLDCLLGSGVAGPARAPYDALIDLCNRSPALRISVDVPSGFPFEPAVKPNITLTIAAPKVGMTRKNSGETVTLDIGFPPEAWRRTGPGELLLIPAVRPDAHKGDRGILGVLAGGPYSGAPALVALGAQALGVDLVHVATPESVASVVRGFEASLIVHPLEGAELRPATALRAADVFKERRCAAVVIGPGLGRSHPTLLAVRTFLERCPVPAAADADAMHALQGVRMLPTSVKRGLVTPHAGEFKVLTGREVPEGPEEARGQAVRGAAARLGTTILFKSKVDIVSDGDRLKFNDTGVPAMAVGGTGDVLVGVAGALLSKGMAPYDAARTAAFLSGAAGQLAFEEVGHSLKPTDVIAKLPRVLSRHLPWWGGRP